MTTSISESEVRTFHTHFRCLAFYTIEVNRFAESGVRFLRDSPNFYYEKLELLLSFWILLKPSESIPNDSGMDWPPFSTHFV